LQSPEASAQYATRADATAFQQLAQLVAIDAAALDRVPAVGTFAARRLQRIDLHLRSAIKLPSQHRGLLSGGELTTDAQTELHWQSTQNALQSGRQATVSGQQFKAAINLRQRTDADETAASASGKVRSEAVIGIAARQQPLTRRAMTQQDGLVLRYALADWAPVQLQLITLADPVAKLCNLAVQADAAGTDPVLGFAPRSEPKVSKKLLYPLSQADRTSPPRPRASSPSPAALVGA